MESKTNPNLSSKFNFDQISIYDSKLNQFSDKTFSYGTSGFRYDENELDKIVFRVAIVSCIKSISSKGMPTGIIITASHNKYTDNGLKIAAEDGHSISPEWENKYTKIVNSKNLKNDLENLLSEFKDFTNYEPIINIACDTRRSSPGLTKIAIDAFKLMNAKYKDYGVLTAPAMHFLTLINQTVYKKGAMAFKFVEAEEYWNYLRNSYNGFNLYYDKFYGNKNMNDKNDRYEKEVIIDCTFGAAAYNCNKILSIFGCETKNNESDTNEINTDKTSTNKNNTLQVKCINTDYTFHTYLNDQCGAEYVHKDRKLPKNADDKIFKNITVDGDVDRIIY